MDKQYYRDTFSKDDLRILLKSAQETEQEKWDEYLVIKDKVEMLESLIEEGE